MIYYSNNCGEVVSTYLDLIQLEKCDVERTVSAIKAFIVLTKFYVKSLIGIGPDNTSVMDGINDGVYTKLKKGVP